MLQHTSICLIPYSIAVLKWVIFYLKAPFWSWFGWRSSHWFRLIVHGPHHPPPSLRIKRVYFRMEGNTQLARKLYLSISLAWIFNGRLTQSSFILQEWPVSSPLQIDCVFSFTYWYWGLLRSELMQYLNSFTLVFCMPSRQRINLDLRITWLNPYKTPRLQYFGLNYVEGKLEKCLMI